MVFSLLGCLALYCKKCLVTCLYGTCLSIFAVLVLVISIILLFITGVSNSTIDNFCAEDFSAMPFGLGSSLEGSVYTPTSIDAFLNSPEEILCTDSCPCVSAEEFNSELWEELFGEDFFTNDRPNG